jgi:excisionase family DNA binding protein
VTSEQTWFTLHEAAVYCRCSTVTLGREARRGTLKGYKLARRREWRFAKADLDNFLTASSTPIPFQPKATARVRQERAS